jgi:hypothetical protein
LKHANRKLPHGPFRGNGITASPLPRPIGDAASSPDAETWDRMAAAYIDLRNRLTELLGRPGITPALQRELILRIGAASQASRQARERAALPSGKGRQ